MFREYFHIRDKKRKKEKDINGACKWRPQNTEGRLGKEIRTYDFLDSIGIHYERVDHKPAMTIEACEEVDKILGAVICKNLFLCNRQETDFYLLLMPGDKKFKTKDLSAQINSSGFLLQSLNIWNSFWILLQVQPVFWG